MLNTLVMGVIQNPFKDNMDNSDDTFNNRLALEILSSALFKLNFPYGTHVLQLEASNEAQKFTSQNKNHLKLRISLNYLVAIT